MSPTSRRNPIKWLADPFRPRRFRAAVITVGEEVAERWRMHKTDSIDPDPQMGRAHAEFHRKLRESKARTDAEDARRAERPEDDAGEVHQHPDPDA